MPQNELGSLPSGVIKEKLRDREKHGSHSLGGVVGKAVERLLRGNGDGAEEIVVRQLAEQRENLTLVQIPAGGVVRVASGIGEAETPAVFFGLGDDGPRLYSSRTGEGNDYVVVGDGVDLGGELRVGPKKDLVDRLGVDETMKGITVQVIDGQLWILDQREQAEKIRRPLSTRALKMEEVPRLSEARELLVKFDADLPAPTLYRAGRSSAEWQLVSFSPSQGPEEVLLVKVTAGRDILYKQWRTEDFCGENNTTIEELRRSLAGRARFTDPVGGVDKLGWAYGGKIDGKVVMFRSVAVSGDSKPDFVILDPADYLRIIGKPGENLSNVASSGKQEGLYHPEGRPIEGNVLRCRKARFLPDMHAGFDVANPWGNMLDGLESDEVVVMQELIDRGVNPWMIIDRAKELVMKGQGVYMIGNHEGMFLAGVAGDISALANWLVEGGDAMISSCGYDMSGFDKTNPFGNRDFLGRIQLDLSNNPRLERIRDLRDFLVEHGKTYMLVDGVLAVHAGIPADENGVLLPMKDRGREVFGGATGINLLEAMQAALRNGNADGDGLKILYPHGSHADDTSPLWVREPFFRVASQPRALHQLRSQLNEQLSNIGVADRVELIVCGHSPQMVDQQRQTTSLRQRVAFIDGGLYQNGTQRRMDLVRRPERPNEVEVVYRDPSSRGEILPLIVGIYDLAN